jgi:hypothetical protein
MPKSRADSYRRQNQSSCAAAAADSIIGAISPMARRMADPRPRPARPKSTRLVNWLTFLSSQLCLLRGDKACAGATEMTSFHGEFGNGSFEAGRVLWHARLRRANHEPASMNGVASPQVGFVRPDRTAAPEDAKSHVDRFGPHRASRDDSSRIQIVSIA